MLLELIERLRSVLTATLALRDAELNPVRLAELHLRLADSYRLELLLCVAVEKAKLLQGGTNTASSVVRVTSDYARGGTSLHRSRNVPLAYCSAHSTAARCDRFVLSTYAVAQILLQAVSLSTGHYWR